jgi:hypothetical protein
VLELKGEALLREDRTQKAALLYEAAYLTEAALHQPAHAVQDYLAAYNSDSRSRLPLFALLRMFERRSSYKNLARLYDAALRSARSGQEKADALIDLSCLDLIHGGDPQAAMARLLRALENDTTGAAALLLEANRRSAGDQDGIANALKSRSHNSDDPTQRGVLLLEIALLREQAGDVRGALDSLRSAALEKPHREIFLIALTRFAREHGFTGELVEASELRAELIAGELEQQLLSPEPDNKLVDLLRSRAVALWYEAARLRCSTLSDPRGAIDCLSKALETRPDDLLLRKTRMLAYDLLEDRKSAADEARALLAQGAEGEDAAPLHFRLAELALVDGDTTQARESLMEAIATASGSLAADAILDDLLLDDQRHLDRIERRESRAASADPERAARWLLEAAELAAHELKDPARALALFERADHKFPGQVEAARAAYAAALSTGDAALSRFAVERMLALSLEPHEHTALLHHAIDQAVTDEDARRLLATAIDGREERAVLARIACSRAAEAKDFALLSSAHEALANLAAIDDEHVAHLAAGARASVRQGDLARARGLLDRALARDATHPYATALLEEVLRRQGQGEELIALLRRAADNHDNAESAEGALLSAGLSAEREGNLERAQKLYEEAAGKAETPTSALWCLLRLAARKGDGSAIRRVQEQLAQLEQKRGEAGIECLLAAELLDGDEETQARSIERLSAALAQPKIAPHAALVLALGPAVPSETRARALDVLEAASEGAQRALWVREQLSAALLNGEPQALVLELCDEVLRLSADDAWASYVKTCVPLPHDEDGHASALAKLSALSSDTRIKQALDAEALWTRRLIRTGELGEEALAQSQGGDGFARLMLQLAAPARDDEARSAALTTLFAHAEGEEQLELKLAAARADLRRGEPQLALSSLQAILAQTPDELSALELKRVAGRAALDFHAVVEAAEALAALLDGDLALTLLEESALVRMDELDDRATAESLLRTVLGRAPTRSVAYARLHELLSQKGDSQELIRLVRGRTEHVHDADELIKLFYELARLHRARGDLNAALDAIDNVLMLDEHVGALALAAEIHTSREEWDEAVRALEAMAGAAGVPKTQRRLARLGAADFLQHRLARPADALAQLELLRSDGHTDAELTLRIADTAERAKNPRRAIEALVQAAKSAGATEKSALLLRAARLTRDELHRSGDAATLFREALEVAPLQRDAVRELWGLTASQDDVARFEREVRAALGRTPLDASLLRDLRTWGELSGNGDGTFISLLTLNVLSYADDHERKLGDAALKVAFAQRLSPGARLSNDELSALLTPAPDPRYAALMRCVGSAAAEIDQLEPSKFGVGRSQRINPRDKSPLRDELEGLCAVLGITLGELYVGGNELLRVSAIPRDDDLSLVLGMGVTAPLSPTRRSQLARELAAHHLHALPLLTRTRTQAARLMWAALVAAECALPQSILDDLGELPRSLGRALPRKVRKALPELCSALPDGGRDMPRQCELLLFQTRRLALAIGGDLQACLDDAVGAMAAREAIASDSGAVDLIRAWTSAPMAQLRKKLGLAQ